MTLRQEKVRENIKNLAAQFLEKESNRTSLITITDADVSKDLKQASIFITVLPTSNEQPALDFVKRQRSDFRHFLQSKLKMKFTPFLDFAIDEGEKNRQRIDELSQDL